VSSVDVQWAEKILSRRGFLQALLVEVAAAEFGDLQPPNLGAEKRGLTGRFSPQSDVSVSLTTPASSAFESWLQTIPSF
jgi:hypothetical protein